MPITPINFSEEALIFGSLFAAGFNYFNMPGGIGADIDSCILKGLQSGLGMFTGITISFFFDSNRKGQNSILGILEEWFGNKNVRGHTVWQPVFSAAIAGTIACLVVPDNQALQAGAVFLTPVIKKWDISLP